MKKLLAFNGLSPLTALSGWLKRRMSTAELQNRRKAMLEHEEIMTVHVEGWKEPHYALAADATSRHSWQVAAQGPIPQDTTMTK